MDRITSPTLTRLMLEFTYMESALQSAMRSVGATKAALHKEARALLPEDCDYVVEFDLVKSEAYITIEPPVETPASE